LQRIIATDTLAPLQERLQRMIATDTLRFTAIAFATDTLRSTANAYYSG
jgi:hypothetical protein